MRKRKRCPYCKKLFWPDPRSAWRQWACGGSSCQERRRRDTQRRWRAKNAEDQAGRRYRAAIAAARSSPREPPSAPKTGPFRGFPWDDVKDEISPEVLVTLVFLARLLVSWTKDEKRVQQSGITKEFQDLLSRSGEDETDGRARPP